MGAVTSGERKSGETNYGRLYMDKQKSKRTKIRMNKIPDEQKSG